MILSRISRYITEHGRADTTDIALHFGIAPEALLGMLELLENKGRIRALPAQAPSCGSSCRGCAINNCSTQIWEMVPRL